MPRAANVAASASGAAIVLRSGAFGSARSVARSKNTAPGMCAAEYSARASRFIAGRYQLASITRTLGSESRGSSHAGSTRSDNSARLDRREPLQDLAVPLEAQARTPLVQLFGDRR